MHYYKFIVIFWVNHHLVEVEDGDHRTTAVSNSVKLSHAMWGHMTVGSWWRGLTECGPLEKGMTNHFSILALRTP